MFAILVLVAVAAIPADQGFVVQEETHRGTYYTLTGSTVKADVQECERFVVLLERDLAVQIPHFHYYRVQNAQQVELFTKVLAEGMTYLWNNSVYSTYPCHWHEMVHLAMGQLGEPEHAFAEGVAMMLGNGIPDLKREYACDQLRKRNIAYQQFLELFSKEPNSMEQAQMRIWAYGAADAWMRSLRSRYGMRKIRAFFQDSCTIADTEAAFTEVFKKTPEESFNVWLYGRKGPSK